MTLEKINQTISELIDAVICGNKVKGNESYEKMAKSVTFVEIRNYCYMNEIEIVGAYWVPKGANGVQPRTGYSQIAVSKVDFFDKIVKGSL